MIIPWRVDVPQDRRPFMNWLIVAGAITAFVLQTMSVMEQNNKLPAEMEAIENKSVEEVAEEFGVDEQSLQQIEQLAEKRQKHIDEIFGVRDNRLAVKDRLIKKMILSEYFVLMKVRPFVLNGWKIKGLFGHM